MRSIFLSYRRDDAEGQAGRLFDDLTRDFGNDAVFMDVAAIDPGRDFRRAIDEQVASCGVLLAIIGKSWLTEKDESGARRIDDPMDFVRLETASALKRDIPVIPVLVQGTKMPRVEDLPDDLKELAFRNAVELTHARWDSDVQLLVKALRSSVQTTPAAADSRPQSPPSEQGHGRPGLSRMTIAALAGVLVLVFGGYVWHQKSAGVAAEVAANQAAGPQTTQRALQAGRPAGGAFPMPAGIANWWRFEGGADDVGGSGFSAMGGITTIEGKVGLALHFDGIDGHLFLWPAGDPGLGSFTIEAWIRISSRPQDAQVILQQFAEVPCEPPCKSLRTSGYVLGTLPGGALWWKLRDSDSARDGDTEGVLTDVEGPLIQEIAGATAAVNDGRFHHIAALRDVDTRELQLYVDGALYASAALSYYADGAFRNDARDESELVVGAGQKSPSEDYLRFFAGDIDELSYYGRALAPEEIKDIFDAGAAGKTRARRVTPPAP